MVRCSCLKRALTLEIPGLRFAGASSAQTHVSGEKELDTRMSRVKLSRGDGCCYFVFILFLFLLNSVKPMNEPWNADNNFAQLALIDTKLTVRENAL
jgi:hypothetical protein